MGQKDVTEKNLIACSDVFADILDYCVSHSKNVVREEDLVDAQPFSQYKADGMIHEQIRDVAKYWRDGQVTLALCGFENQTAVDRTMVLRLAGYDGAVYHAEARQGGRLYPAMSFVLYTGTEHPWTGPKTLHEAIEVREDLKPFVPDYKMNVLNVAWIPEEDIQLFRSDFRYVVEYLVMKRLHKEYKPSNEQIRHIDEVLKLMTVLTGDPCFEEVLNNSKEGRKPQTMCELVERFINKGRAEGMAQGVAQGVAQGIAQGMAQGVAQGIVTGIKGAVSICRSVGMKQDEIRSRIMQQFNITYAEANRYLVM